MTTKHGKNRESLDHRYFNLLGDNFFLKSKAVSLFGDLELRWEYGTDHLVYTNTFTEKRKPRPEHCMHFRD